jgi:chromosome segregation ATPase
LSNEEALQAWIDATLPTPVAILREIADVSPPHDAVLTKIACELEHAVLVSRPAPLIAANASFSYLLFEIHDLRKEIDALDAPEERLTEQLRRLDEEKKDLEWQIAEMRRTLDGQTFEKYRKRQRELDAIRDAEDERRAAKIGEERKARLHELWGERHSLREEIAGQSNRLREERTRHEWYAESRANAVIEERQEFGTGM